MIISRWKGFEIDSSEGYYVFNKNLHNKKEGWNFLSKLLKSPLLYKKIAFDIYFNDENQHKKIRENWNSH